MAAGGGLGYVYFAGVKYAGYAAAALLLKKAFNKPDSNVFKVGLARTGIGLAVGGLFGGAAILLTSLSQRHSTDDLVSFLFFAFLIPTRMGEWFLLIHLFFDKGLTERQRDTKYAALGTIWSFVLDAVGIFAAFVVPGGFWIC